ncbi:MAG: glucose 1-dehydrogenase [Catenibacterium mitsuokai]|jgi:NAD(P)-dependent dehydrogenase (short-subunit alcohol dehydrogenase family)|uniref:SDR family NAD(P)-dependent oxidoreductase n=1 Tax=Catenibacterium sp. UBA627 TaxID=1946309 RepID=UPI00257F1CBC|nr:MULTISPECIES: glucose 1-dehydrogenase [Catenibacterium]MDY3675782.1 glucose 1-dehydrogenase [Catenibacterium mitsuokai]
MISFDLTGKVAVITGASSGLGEQFAKALSEQGCDVAVLARRVERLEELSKKLKENGHDCLPVACDVTNEESIKEAVKKIEEHYGHIDILVNNAGVVEYSSGLHDHTTEQWDKVLNTDLKGVFLMGREVSKVMIKQNSGKIINIASVGGIQAGPAQVSYFAAKGGVVNLTKAMAGDLAPYGILVNAIAPGVYDTEMTHGALDAPGSLVLKNRVALKRFGREGEMNGALVYFASDACTYTTGQTLVVDGGMTSML